MKSPVLIEIGLIGSVGEAVDPQLLPSLAELNQADRALVLLAERPDGWKPTRNRVDQAFKQQQDIEATIKRGGGMLDAILYLDFSLFSRKRHRCAALEDLAERYGCPIEQLHAIVQTGGRIAETVENSPLASITTDRHHHSLQQRISEILTSTK